MVALLVVSISLFAVFRSSSSVIWHTSAVTDKIIANWVAQNQIALYRSKKTWDNVSNRSGQVTMGGVEWHWRMRIGATENPQVRKIDVNVFGPDDDIKAQATGYTAKLL